VLSLERVSELAGRMLGEVERAIVGKRAALELVLLGILGDGHVLLEDYPGLAKTLIARSFAQAAAVEFTRVQFTPDLLPADITGSAIFNQREGEFEFRPGPIFTNLLLADEINRAPPKTQAALLEAMQERQVTTGRETRALAAPFVVIATQNPIEYEGTYPLPEAQLDRFLLRLRVGYPSLEDEREVMLRRLDRGADDVELNPIVDAATLVEMQASLEQVYVAEAIVDYIARLVRATRESPRVQVGSSPRGGLAVLKLARGHAVLRGRGYVTPEDVKGGGGAGARAPVDGGAGAVAAAAARRRARRGVSRAGADAGGRGSRAAAVVTAATPRLRAAVWLAAVGIVLALALGRSEPAAVAAPFALLAIVGLQHRRPVRVEVELGLERDRAEEGDRVAGRLSVRSADASDRLEVELLLPPGLAVEQQLEEAFALPAGGEREFPLTVVCERWGAYSAGLVRLRRYDRLRLVAHDQELDVGPPLRVYPSRETLRSLVQPAQTQASVGDQVARRKGEGIELAELRPYSPGDELRRVNWRASARSGELVVNEHHPERNASVVLLLDTFAELGGRRNPLDRSLRAAVALAGRYLARRDRVGLLVLGAGLRWLRPGSGALQLHRIVDTLLELRAVPPRREPLPLRIPSRLLPPQTLVLAISPLLDDAIVDTLANLRSRRFDLAVLEVPALPYLAAQSEPLAANLIALERDLLRARLRARAIPLVEWRQQTSLEAAVRSIEEFRRSTRVVRAS